MGLFDNILNKIAPPEEEGFEPEYKPDQTAYIPRDPRIQDNAPATTVPATTTTTRGNGTNVMGMGSSIEMKVMKPDRFEMVGEIADLLLAGNTVLLNLEDTNKETTRKLIDFMNGVAYAIGGELRRIANNTYVVTPNNVKISDEDSTPELSDNTSEVY